MSNSSEYRPSDENLFSIDLLKKMNKRLPLSGSEGTLTLLKYIFLVLPVYIALILPLAIITYPAKFFIKPAKQATPKSDYTFAPPAKVEPLNNRKYHAVIYGATGFTGRLASEYIAKNYSSFPWAIAGRNKQVLESIHEELLRKYPSAKIDILVGDSSKPESLVEIIKSTRVIMCTAGPFSLYASPVVQACAVYGTHYVDITGESDWVRKMIDINDETARKTGAKIVHHCGHDCIPWDLSVYKVAQELKKQGQDLVKVECFDEISENASGGTMNTLFLSLQDRKKYKATLGYDPLMKPMSTSGDVSGPSPSKTDAKNQEVLGFNKKALGGKGAWVGPFVMSMVMANCVRRSNALLQYSGPGKLKYQEAKLYPSLAAGICDMIYMVVFGTCLYSPVLSKVLQKHFVAQPGEGPSKELMDQGFLRVTVTGTGSQNAKVSSSFVLETDPGYRDTARLLVESGLALALDNDKLQFGGGVYTPAVMGDILLNRIVKTGAKFQIEKKD